MFVVCERPFLARGLKDVLPEREREHRGNSLYFAFPLLDLFQFFFRGSLLLSFRRCDVAGQQRDGKSFEGFLFDDEVSEDADGESIKGEKQGSLNLRNK